MLACSRLDRAQPNGSQGCWANGSAARSRRSQFAGTWLDLGPDQMSRLPRDGIGQFNRLGIDACAGARAWDIGSRIVTGSALSTRRSSGSSCRASVLLAQIGAFARAYLGGETAVV